MIVIAPFANDALRDWPFANYHRFLALCVAELDAAICLVGSRNQRAAINALVRPHSADRVQNRAGRCSWDETGRLIGQARAVVSNNSGIAHLSARLGTPTLCLFAASHDPWEWSPKGPHVTTLFSHTACAPCTNSGRDGCPFAQRCMHDISPEMAFRALGELLEQQQPYYPAQSVAA
jgi:ADP-heptose:LPS heptosyltransferase